MECVLFQQLSAGNSGDTPRVPLPMDDDTYRTSFRDCSISITQLTESLKSFSGLY